MMIVKARSFPRAGFLGNPSDGYYGKTLSFAFTEYCVDLTLTESAKMRFVPGEVDDATFDSPENLVRDIRLYGYYGGIRMLKAVAKLFFEYCFEHDITLPKRNFSAEYKINIPRLVGLSGSSAICSAMLKALCKFYEVPIVEDELKSTGIPLEYAPTICLEAEKLELGINCGFQDRVIQMYNGLVFMDFERSFVEEHNFGRYERLDPKLLPNIYVAFDPNRAEESGKAHKKVKRLFEEKKPDILSAMSEFADIAQQGRDLLVAREKLIEGQKNQGETTKSTKNTKSLETGRSACFENSVDFVVPKNDEKVMSRIAELVNANFDLRDRIFNVAEQNRQMVMTARSAGASAKFAGSGGAIVGTYEDEEQFAALTKALAGIGCTTFRPTIARKEDELADRTTSAIGSGTWRNS